MDATLEAINDATAATDTFFATFISVDVVASLISNDQFGYAIEFLAKQGDLSRYGHII
jgi:hypothetical protein